MGDDDSSPGQQFRVAPVNNDLSRIYKGDTLVGHVRRGLDLLWYPELEAERHRSAAIQRVIVAHEACLEYQAQFNGHG